MDDAVRVLADLANEGYSRGWDRLDRADKVEEVGRAIGGIHAEWMSLQDKLAAYERVVEAARRWVATNGGKLSHARATTHEVELAKAVRAVDALTEKDASK